MNDPNLHIKHVNALRSICLAILILAIIPFIARAQDPVVIEVNSSNITGLPFASNTAFSANSCLLSLGTTISGRAATEFTALSTPAPQYNQIPALSAVRMIIKSVSGTVVDLLPGITPRYLSTSSQTLNSSVLSLLKNGGPVVIEFSIPTPPTYYAGNYTTKLEFPVTEVVCGNHVYENHLNLNVLAFINAAPTNPLIIKIDNFDQFRSTGATITQSIVNTRTVPLTIQLKGQDKFDFTANAGINNPNTSIQGLRARLNMPVTGSYQGLSANFETLSGANNLEVPISNQQTVIINYSLTPAALVEGFMQAGTYSNAIYGQLIDARSNPSSPATTLSTLTPLSIQVADLQEIHINQTEVNLNFNQLSDYKNGVGVDMPNHLTISKTNPFDIYVKAEVGALVNGNYTIPLNCLQIGPASGQSEVQTVTLSTTSQKIISAASPCLDKNFNIRYSIPADKVPDVLGKPPGVYTATVTYSFTAP